jgi:hypothetical protein
MAIVTPAAELAARKRELPDDGGIRVLDRELIAENQAVRYRLAAQRADQELTLLRASLCESLAWVIE